MQYSYKDNYGQDMYVCVFKKRMGIFKKLSLVTFTESRHSIQNQGFTSVLLYKCNTRIRPFLHQA